MLSAAKHLALMLVGGKAQSAILRCAQDDSEGLRITAGKRSRSKNITLKLR
jgi:hypothetical protein